MKIRNTDTETFRPDESSVLKHYLGDRGSFSISILDIDGTHRNTSEAEIAYYVLEGEGIIHLESKIIDMDEKEVVYVGKNHHTLEGNMKLLAVRNPSAEKPEQAL